MARIVLAELSKVFPGGVRAVNKLNLAVEEGEFFSLLGPSGCGKTTTLRLIAGLETPTAGEIWFGQRRMSDVPAQLRNVGLVFQDYAVFPTMTVYDNAAYGLRVRRLPEAEVRRRVLDHLALVGLEGLEHRMPAQLSGGQLQRVALARALVIEPRVLLLDEPLSNLDASLRQGIRKEIKRIQQRLGITTIYVTHDQEEALAISTRVGVMKGGALEQVASPATLYGQPASAFVAQFVGEGTILHGEFVRAGSAGGAVRVGPHLIPVPAGAPPLSGSGGPAWVCVRPEAVILLPPGSDPAALPPRTEPAPLPAPGPLGALEGRIEDLEFLGPTVRGELRVPGLPANILFTCPAPLATGRLRVGDKLAFRLDPAGVAVGATAAPSGSSPPESGRRPAN